MNEIIPIKSLEIKIDKNSKAPHVVLNGVDFINEKIGLRGLQIVWEKISEKLSEKNWTIYKLCLKAGIGTAGIYRLRDGEIKDLYFDTVKKIADALEISTDELR